MNIYLPDVHHAKLELARLRGIETDLQSKVIELMNSNHYMASSWRSIYTDRLRDNVRPAIKECVDFIKSHD